MNAYGRNNEHRAITLALSTISGTIVSIVAAASVLTSGVFEKEIRMLAPARPFEALEANIYNEIKSLKDEVQSLKHAIQDIESRMELLPTLPRQAAAGVEIEKTKNLVDELSSNNNKKEDIMPQNAPRQSVIWKASRTRSRHSLPHKRWH